MKLELTPRLFTSASELTNKEIMYQGLSYTVHVLKRPHFDAFIERMFQLYEIIFYTASVKEYADTIIDYIDPNNYAKARYYRESWKKIDGSFVKDLSVINRNLKSTVIIDNSPIAYCLNPDNGIPIKGFYNDLGDEELLKLIPILEEIALVEDTQQFIQGHIEKLTIEHGQ